MVHLSGDDRRVLRDAMRAGSLTMYLGAGVSKANGLLTWQELVLAMYFEALVARERGMSWQSFPNYLFALAEWQLERRRESIEITARKLRDFYGGDDEAFVAALKKTLYAGLSGRAGRGPQAPPPGMLRGANPLLDAVATLCGSPPPAAPRRARAPDKRVAACITYNYDDLLEIAGGERVQPVWKKGQRCDRADVVPVFHVNGFAPMRAGPWDSDREGIVFTEDQFNLATRALTRGQTSSSFGPCRAVSG
jgi:hypothetical protein